LRAELLTPRLSGKFVGEVRLEMRGRGFALVDTPHFFDDSSFLGFKRSTTLRSSHINRWRGFPELARHGGWLERLLGMALPEESLCLAALEFRHEPADSEDQEVDRLHADGSYLRSVCTLYGPTTIYRDGRAEWSVPCGQTLLVTAMDRARALGLPCTLHRRPGAGPERAVIVCSFEPRQGPPRRADADRRAARDHARPRKSADFRGRSGEFEAL
jgi:hypothetical protein